MVSEGHKFSYEEVGIFHVMHRGDGCKVLVDIDHIWFDRSGVSLRFAGNQHIYNIMIIFKKFSFDSAHYLPNVPEGHKCREIHGHTYQLTVFIKGPIDDEVGWVMDFSTVKEAANSVVDLLDHKLLNKIPGLENPTCEILCAWIWEELKERVPMLSKVELYETPTSGAIYEGG